MKPKKVAGKITGEDKVTEDESAVEENRDGHQDIENTNRKKKPIHRKLQKRIEQASLQRKKKNTYA